MEPMQSMKIASLLLAIAAAGGLLMAIIRFGGRNPPPALAMAHGFLAAAAVTILAYAAYTVGLPTLAMAALGLFVLAALGGAYMNLNFHWKSVPIPKSILVGHALLAVAGFGLLLVATFMPPTA